MFTGIIETCGIVRNIIPEQSNVHFQIESEFTNELKVDQSVAHNGVCLTVTKIEGQTYWVTAINETLKITNLSNLSIGSLVNLERCLQYNGRIDGHIVQGHIDQSGTCISKVEANGSWEFKFSYDPMSGNYTVKKGSICINGVSLTVVESGKDYFSVAIIPYTYNHTNFKNLQITELVNLEFDILGKYISKWASMQQN
jgi:riboflavin synthase